MVDEYGALRQLLQERCPGSTFRESDIRRLWDAGFESEADLEAADRESLTSILPERQGKVAILLRTFAQSEATTERESKRGRTGERRARDSNDEFRKWEPPSEAESFDMRSWVAGNSVPTDSISQVMKEFDGFPLKYFVRREETMLLECVEEIMGLDRDHRFPTDDRPKLAILGSPRVGKSCFLVFLAFYLARCRSQSVLLVRRLSCGDSPYAVVFLS